MITSVPDYAGLIYVSKEGIREIKYAPKLHPYKHGNRLMSQIATRCYWRYHNQRQDLHRCVDARSKYERFYMNSQKRLNEAKNMMGIQANDISDVLEHAAGVNEKIYNYE